MGLILLLVLPFLTPYKALASQMLIFAIFAIGFDIVFGYTGLLHLVMRHFSAPALTPRALFSFIFRCPPLLRW